MWTSTEFKTYKKQFDFSSSEQGKPTFTALKIGESDFINMIESLEGEINENLVFQTLICTECGYHHCAPGNWVAIRKHSDFVFFIPAFEDIAQEETEYEPPFLLKQNGTYWLPKKEFENFKILVPAIDKLNEIKRLTKSELIWLYKWDTPHKMFGNFPNFEKVRKNHILAVSDFDNKTISKILNDKLNEIESAENFGLELLSENDQEISFFLDDNLTTEWKAMWKNESEFGLLLGGKFKIRVT